MFSISSSTVRQASVIPRLALYAASKRKTAEEAPAQKAASSTRRPKVSPKVMDPKIVTPPKIKQLLEICYWLLAIAMEKQSNLPDSFYLVLTQSPNIPQLNKYFPGDGLIKIAQTIESKLGKESGQAHDWMTQDLYDDFIVGLRTFAVSYSKYPGAMGEAVKAFDAFYDIFTRSTGNPTGDKAYYTLEKVALQGNFPSWVLSMFARDVGPDYDGIKEELMGMVEKLTGRKRSFILHGMEEIKKMTQSPMYPEWKIAYKRMIDTYKAYVALYVMHKGVEGKADYKEVVEYLDSNDIPHLLPKGFVGYIDAGCRIFPVVHVKQGTRVVAKPDATPFALIPPRDRYPLIQMGKNPGSIKLVSWKKEISDYSDMDRDYVPPGGYAEEDPVVKDRHAYTQSHQTESRALKFDSVRTFLHTSEQARKQWMHFLTGGATDIATVFNKFDPNHTANSSVKQLYAAILEYVWQTASRISSAKGGMTADSETFGALSLRVKHLFPEGSPIVAATKVPTANASMRPKWYNIRYAGKKNIAINHSIGSSRMTPTDRLFFTPKDSDILVAILYKLTIGKDPEDFVFSPGPGKSTPAVYTINSFLRGLSGAEEVSVHYIRSHHATKIFVSEIKTLSKALKAEFRGKKPSDSERQAKVGAMVRMAALKVGEKLGHQREGETEATTSLRNYIDPLAQKDAYDAFFVRPPAMLEGLMGVGLHNVSSAHSEIYDEPSKDGSDTTAITSAAEPGPGIEDHMLEDQSTDSADRDPVSDPLEEEPLPDSDLGGQASEPGTEGLDLGVGTEAPADNAFEGMDDLDAEENGSAPAKDSAPAKPKKKEESPKKEEDPLEQEHKRQKQIAENLNKRTLITDTLENILVNDDSVDRNS